MMVNQPQSSPPSSKRFIIFVVILILLIAGRLLLNSFVKMNHSADVERAKAWLKEHGRKGPWSHLVAAKKNDEPAPVEKFASHTFLMPLTNGPVLRLGLDESLTYEQAEKIAGILRGRCLSPNVDTAGKQVCPDGIKIDPDAWSEISKCPVQVKASPSLPGLRFNSPAKIFYLICSPADACRTFDQGKFQLEFLAAPPAVARKLGEIFDLIWRPGVCERDLKETSPEKINRVYITTDSDS